MTESKKINWKQKKTQARPRGGEEFFLLAQKKKSMMLIIALHSY
jgi:hypothetical protein